MGAISFKRSSLEDFNKYNSLLVGNAFTPPPAVSAYDLLETEILTSNASSVTFTGLDSYTDYKHLQIRMVTRTDSGGTINNLRFTLNGDTSSSYTSHFMDGTGSTVRSIAEVSLTSAGSGYTAGGASASNSFGGTVLDILDFSDSSKNTTIRSLIAAESASRVGIFSGLYANTSAITEINIFSDGGWNLVTGSRFSLYGIKAA